MRKTCGSRNSLLWKVGVVAGLFMLGVSPVHAEVDLLTSRSADPWATFLPTSSRLSLLDASKLDISHQVVFSYQSGSGGKSGTGGLWLTRFRYPVSNPLTLDVSIGSSLSHSTMRGLQADKLFLESFSLRYTPNEKCSLLLMYRGIPSSHLYFPGHHQY